MISGLRHPEPSYDQSRNHLGVRMYVSSYAIKKSSLPRKNVVIKIVTQLEKMWMPCHVGDPSLFSGMFSLNATHDDILGDISHTHGTRLPSRYLETWSTCMDKGTSSQ